MLIIGHRDVRHVLEGQEDAVLALVGDTYRLHEAGRTAVPHSVFLRFPDSPRDRIIGLPAYAGGEQPAAGMKWIASFPGNVARGKERASAAILLNSMEDGGPRACVEASVISARRTAASAALAAVQLVTEPEPYGIALVGCGPINREVLRFVKAALPSIREVVVFDLDADRAADFAARAGEGHPDLRFVLTESAQDALGAHQLVSLATTAGEPHMDLSACAPGATVLHVSLRDLTVDAILGAQNVVDDADHVCRERTSLHLAEQATGGREFIDASIGELLSGESGFRRDPERVAVFSPFGLGVLDIALSQWVYDACEREEFGVRVEGFLP
ncbi:2,3-diaminopropionate biosynthesis protein SbnB [Streptomyces lunaelactis]|uniref:2,3-diaminopropionate biosynthesis protein SbnB n=1 Tax=Streptomyces lunaelactis TaxID=1535768 RepID=UPI0015851CE1|nr:2,3-diaminopropionate biosynthesis protein SbnB [Streptomyces lunaelactis]NUK03891.1 2,3-diaminopropionate biosynthesis protein SbnB [Streptomyces lunaelactis]NUK18915.1 2,3-diaminopropionate biosynthesis protein SbnB [Streptomyces lunaelactis]NUK26331.1 2,3-diaminopropionate biosynthesis protein SbnB [Streptomyces lunaelactis]NUK37357.1 2,3-diaminopropionate biosynthesis protein SbnB [Streptomyces lunaelactis]NUK44023.1 2,3-diaminopropionate biosynthesis protein SbnB [Streptomyces lunaelac